MTSKNNSDARLEALEQKYIELLERRVTELENRLAAGTFSTEPGEKKDEGPSSADNVGKNIVAEEKEHKKEDKDGKTEGEDEEDEFGDDRYLVVLNSLDVVLGEYKDKRADAAPKTSPNTDEKAPTRAFIFRKFMRNQTIRGEEVLRATGSEVDVVSPPLQKLLGEIMAKYEGDTKVTSMSSPYVHLIWSWEAAQAEADEKNIKPNASDEDKEAREDLRALLGMISTSSGDDSLDRYFKNKQSMKDTRTVTFESLWTLFPKGTFILSRPVFNQPQVFVVQS